MEGLGIAVLPTLGQASQAPFVGVGVEVVDRGVDVELVFVRRPRATLFGGLRHGPHGRALGLVIDEFLLDPATQLVGRRLDLGALAPLEVDAQVDVVLLVRVDGLDQGAVLV